MQQIDVLHSLAFTFERYYGPFCRTPDLLTLSFTMPGEADRHGKSLNFPSLPLVAAKLTQPSGNHRVHNMKRLSQWEKP